MRARWWASIRKSTSRSTPSPAGSSTTRWRSGQRTQEVIAGALEKSKIDPKDIAAVGVTNQRETTVVWDKATGKPVYNAIVWQDTRTDTICNELAKDGGQDRFRAKVGLPLATYFSGPKIKWILDNVPGVRAKAEKGEVLFGNIDTWVIWNLTGGPNGGVHVTDVTNASRTMLMNLETLDWDPEMLKIMGIPRAMLPDDQAVQRGLRQRPIGASGGHPRRRRPGRPAGRAVRPDLLQRRRSQEHLRHRLLHAAQHRHQARASPRTAC